MSLLHESSPGIPLKSLCELFGYSRQAYYKRDDQGTFAENAIAERANGIIKREWLYKMQIATRTDCMALLQRIINFYNNERPHMSLGWQTPVQAHRQSGPQKKCWKASYAMG